MKSALNTLHAIRVTEAAYEQHRGFQRALDMTCGSWCTTQGTARYFRSKPHWPPSFRNILAVLSNWKVFSHSTVITTSSLAYRQVLVRMEAHILLQVLQCLWKKLPFPGWSETSLLLSCSPSSLFPHCYQHKDPCCIASYRPLPQFGARGSQEPEV